MTTSDQVGVHSAPRSRLSHEMLSHVGMFAIMTWEMTLGHETLAGAATAFVFLGWAGVAAAIRRRRPVPRAALADPIAMAALSALPFVAPMFGAAHAHATVSTAFTVLLALVVSAAWVAVRLQDASAHGRLHPRALPGLLTGGGMLTSMTIALMFGMHR